MAPAKVSLADLARMKREGRKIVGVVAFDYQVARIVDRVGVDLVSVGDTVGVHMWGHPDPLSVTMDHMVVVGQAVRRGVERALLSIDFPYGPLQESTESALRAARRLVDEAGADMVKVPAAMKDRLVADARRLVAAGASLLDFTNSGPVVGYEVVRAVDVPVLGGLGGGPWLDGRMRLVPAAIGYAASNLDTPTENYAGQPVARTIYDALADYADDVRAGRHLKGQKPARPA
jgi:3-methyl-2-oxobutanoate hydroxymethyltransferase